MLGDGHQPDITIYNLVVVVVGFLTIFMEFYTRGDRGEDSL